MPTPQAGIIPAPSSSALFLILRVLDPAHAAHDVLGVVLLDDAAAGRHVALANGCIEFAERNAVRS